MRVEEERNLEKKMMLKPDLNNGALLWILAFES